MADDGWRKLTQAAPELAQSCEDMMLELEWYAESLRKAGDQSYRGIDRMVKDAKAALLKAGIKVVAYAKEDE